MFTLTVDTAPSLLLPNETSNGFTLITVATGGTRIYRITREKRNLGYGPNSHLDYFDFSLDLSPYQQGTIKTLDIPYSDSLFTPYSPSTPGTTQVGDSSQPIRDLGTIATSVTGLTLFSGEVFKLLYISVSADDPVRETPASINLQAAYIVSGLPRKVQFVYYTIISGQPVYTGYFGNIAFTGQYGPLPGLGTVDTTKLVNVVMDPTSLVDYYVVRVDSTPNVIVTNGIPQTMGSSDSYAINGIRYVLTAAGNGVAGIGFYVTLNVPSGLDPSITENGFTVEPAVSVAGYTVAQLGPTSYRFLIQPALGVTSMDLRIAFVGPLL